MATGPAAGSLCGLEACLSTQDIVLHKYGRQVARWRPPGSRQAIRAAAANARRYGSGTSMPGLSEALQILKPHGYALRAVKQREAQEVWPQAACHPLHPPLHPVLHWAGWPGSVEPPSSCRERDMAPPRRCS